MRFFARQLAGCGFAMWGAYLIYPNRHAVFGVALIVLAFSVILERDPE